MAWDLKYRPLKFSDVLGQPGAVAVLKARLRNGTAQDTSYLFCGGSGMGKTTLGRILARAILCLNLDKADPEPCNECENCKAFLEGNLPAFSERDAASQGTIEHVRQIVDDLSFAVFGASKRIYILDESHRMSKDAQDALLKPIEEKKLVGMFCTTEPEKIRAAIRSRCEEHSIRRATREEILAWVKGVLAKESVVYEDDAVLTVIDYTGGHLRDTLNRLEMISQGGDITVDRVRDQLNLGLVSTYYEVLLRLPVDLPGALAHLDKATERVTAEEAATGLAEAAMNSFRLANNMLADFSFTDRNLAMQVHAVYGNRLIQVTERFLRSRYITNVGLVCDLASLATELGGGTIASAPYQASTAIAPVHVVLSNPAPVAAPIQPAVTQPTQQTQQYTPPPQYTPPQQAQRVAPTTPTKPQVIVTTRAAAADVVNNLGYLPSAAVGGTEPLTVHDAHLGSKVPPPPKTKKTELTIDKSGRDERTPLSPTEWRRAFQNFAHLGAKHNG